VTVQARLADASETDRKYITEAVALSDGQIFVAMPRLVIGEGQPPETDDGKVLFKGKIVDARREAVCGAKVTLNFDMPGWMSMWVRYTLTDQDGRWQMRVPKEYSDLSISLDHPDYIGSHFDRSSEKPSKQELLDGTHVLIMNSGVRITGVVKDGQGKPIENALITAGRFYSWSPYGEVDEDSTTARTLDNGTFSIGGLPEEQLDMMVSATGYGPRVVPVEVKKNMPPVELTLLSGRTYAGQVVDANDRPIEGAKITVDGWRVGRREHHLTRIVTTDAQGNFRMEDLPGEGTIECSFGKRDSGLVVFSKEMPADLSKTDRIVMYKVPVFTGKVIDAGTQQPVTKFTLVNGIRGDNWGDRPHWSDHYKEQINTNDGAFTYKWSGYSVTQPFSGDCLLKIEMKGYLSEMAPPLKLGETCKPFVIRLTKAEPRTGVVLTAGGQPAAEAEVGWVGPDDRAFLTDGRFSTRGYSYQADQIVKTGADGRFELDRTRDEGLIVAVHADGYAAVKSTEFTNGSKVTLIPWARVEGSIVPGTPDGKQLTIAVEQAMSSEALEAEPVRWMFDEVSITGNRFAIEHVPATPLHVGAVIRWEHSDPAYLNPEPGKTYSVEIGTRGRAVTGRIVHPAPGAKMEMSDPRRLHAVAYRTDPEPPMPAEIKSVTRASFQWLWRDADTAYDRSKTFQKRFVPEITDDGEFTFAALAPGKYEFVVNYHVPLGENVSCGRGVLDAVAVSEFTVPDSKATSTVRVPDVRLRLLGYPKVGEAAPLFEAKTFDGGTVKLADLRGKVVLLDFWASWCTPCVAQLPQVQQLYETFGADEKFAMIGMSLDWEIEKAKRFLAGRQLKWPQVSLGNMDTSAVVKQYGVGSIPMTVLIDPEGKIIAMGLSIDQLKERIRTALAAR
jgi:peroxiredoxin